MKKVLPGSVEDDDATRAWELEEPPLLQLLPTLELGGGKAPEMEMLTCGGNGKMGINMDT